MKNFILKKPIPFQKNCAFEIKEMQSDDTGYRVSGYASVFDVIDRVNDKMMKGCFDKTLKKTGGKWPVKMEHKDIIGFNMKAKVDKKGLYVESSLFQDDGIPMAKTAMALVKNCKKFGHNLGLSVGGIVKEVALAFKDGKFIGEIREFEVLEHSITGTPANPEAQIKSLNLEITKQYNAVHNEALDFKIKSDKSLDDFKKLVLNL